MQPSRKPLRTRDFRTLFGCHTSGNYRRKAVPLSIMVERPGVSKISTEPTPGGSA